jgi:2-polyprenyl-6-hydroxyphenyl methylase/3-demethylubiquinone-9 3-methyltransferase
VAKFGELASRWWDLDSEARVLHDINPVRLGFILAHCPLAGKRVVDVGCGGGILSESMAALGAAVIGIDATEPLLTVACLHKGISRLSIDYRQTTAEALAKTEAGSFDCVTCMEMLEHVPDPASVIRACAALARSGGHIFLSTLNRTRKAYFLAILGAEYAVGLLPRGTHTYDKFIRPAELAAYLRDAHLELRDLSGFHYVPGLRKASLAADCSVNYLAYAVKPDVDPA